ncbi:MAG: glycosyltransferase [Nitrospirae bacterium]|nr:glycosyltransferase [Nitrospirota bacterium]
MANKQDILIELVFAKNSSPSLTVRTAESAAKPLHSLYDPETEAATLVSGFNFIGKGLLVVLGLGLGYHIKELITKYPDAELIVIEPDAGIYEYAKAHGTLKNTISSLDVVVGLKPDKALEHISKAQIMHGMRQLSFFKLQSEVSVFSSYFAPIIKALDASVSVKLWERLRYTKFKDARTKILLIDQKYFLTKEIERAAESNGHIVEKVSLTKGEVTGDILPRLIRKIIEFKPDFLMTINHLGFDEEGIIASFLESIDMPAASWYVDSPDLIVRSFTKNALSNIHLFIWDRHYIPSMRSVGFENVIYLPLAADEDVFRPMELSKHDFRKYGADTSFVGNSMVKPYKDNIQKLPASCHEAVEKLAAALSKERVSLSSLIADHTDLKDDINKLDTHQRLALDAAVLWKATMLYRAGLINSLDFLNPVVHGDAGWKSLLSKNIQLKPELHYYSELPQLYNASKINFNATSLQMLGAVNQRVFDVPACRGFLLTDAQDSISDLFEPGKEVITYSSQQEAADLARHFLDNESGRRAVAQAAHQRVLNEHTYRHRMLRITKEMRKMFP